MSQYSLTKEEECAKPFVNGARVLIDGEIREWIGACSNVTSPILNENGDRIIIGTIAMMGASDAVEASNAAKAAWNTGRGKWPQMSMKERIESIQKVCDSFLFSFYPSYV